MLLIDVKSGILKKVGLKSTVEMTAKKAWQLRYPSRVEIAKDYLL